MVTTELFKRFASLDECLFDLGQVGMILERVGGKLRNLGSAFKLPHVELCITKAKVLTVPVNNLAAKNIAIATLGLLIMAIIEFGGAILSVFRSENNGAGFEDHPYGAVSDDAVENEVISCLEVVSELGLKGTMEYFQMAYRLGVFLGFQSFKQVFPAVDECLEGRFEGQTVQGSCDARIVFEDQPEYLFEKRRLNYDRVDLQLLSTIVAFAVADEEGISCTLCVLCGLFKVIRVFVNPSGLASIVRLGLVKVFHISNHSRLDIRRCFIAVHCPVD